MPDRNECLRGIRRPSRLGAVWLSYRTNWPLIVLALPFFAAFLFCIFLVALVSDSTSESTATQGFSNALTNESFHLHRGLSAATILFGGLLINTVLLVQLSDQFTSTGRLLIPNFVRSHLSPIIGVVGIVVLFSVLFYWIIGCTIFVGMSLSGAGVFVLAVSIRSLRPCLRPSNCVSIFPPVTIAVGQFILVLGLPSLAMVFVLRNWGKEFDAYLGGDFVSLNLIFLAGSLWGAVDVVNRLIGMARDLETAGTRVGNVNFGLLYDPGAFGEFVKQLSNSNDSQQAVLNNAYRSFDVRVDRFLDRVRSGDSINAYDLWRFGSSSFLYTRFNATCIFLSGFLCGLITLLLMNYITKGASPSRLEIVLAIAQSLPMAWLFAVGFSLVSAWNRILLQSMEILRPMSRGDWVRIWFRWVAWELVPTLMCAAILCLVSPVWFPSDYAKWSTSTACLVVIVGVGTLVNVYAMFMIVLTLQKSLLNAVGVVVGTYFVICLGTLPIVLFINNRELFTGNSYLVFPVNIVVLYTMAYVALRLARKRWLNWEVGDVE